LGASYSGQIVSLTKMVGSLQDAGNTTTLSAYLNVLKDSGLLACIQKYAVDKARQRASIPKFQVMNSALLNIYSGYTFSEAMQNPKVWGLLFESAIGAHLLSESLSGNYEVFYWREGNLEVDYILKKGKKIVAIEVKSNTDAMNKGLSVFREQYKPYASMVVGNGGIDAVDFLSINPSILFT
jgi:predicted AAA+ superfamily ATPase